MLKGKCKYCGAKIHIHHLVVEVITPLVFIALFWKFAPDLILFAKYSILFAFLIPIFFIDLYHKLILDKLTIPMFIIGLGFALLPNTDIGIVNALATSFGILFLMLVIAWLFEKVRHKEGMGGGDIKLLAAMSTFLGFMNISFILIFGSVFAIVSTVVLRPKDKLIPYGPFLAIGAFIWVMIGSSFLEWYFNLILR